jgi:lysozyme family protein
MMTPRTFARDYITRWEDGGSTDPAKTHSMRPTDPGNWSSGKVNVGLLIGSNHGVTPIALAAHRKVPVTTITVAVMHALTVDEAATIALDDYFFAPGLDRLMWSQPVAIMMDGGWGMGPGQMVKLVQRALDLTDDGRLGPTTAATFNKMLAQAGPQFMAGVLWTLRDAFYEQIIAAKPYLAEDERGWDNRSLYFTPGQAEGWWQRFAA